MLNWLFKPSVSKHLRTAIGLMSGTSLDALDAALVRETDSGQIEVVTTQSTPFPADLQQQLEQLVSQGESRLSAILQIEHQYTELVIAQCQQLIAASATAIDVIGFHGQTVWHAPEIGSTLQLGNAEWLAEATQTPVIAQFRRGDMARGGQGAPLAPLFHAAHFARDTESVGVLNLGGIANLTVLRPGHAPCGWDIGPANTLSDQWYRQFHKGPYDAQGAWAGTGQVNPSLLEQMLSDAYFQKPAPKSTGREYFNLPWLQTQLTSVAPVSEVDVQATIHQLTAELVRMALPDDIEILVVCGGGVHNTHLMDRIDDAVDALLVTSDTFLIDPMAVESACFGWLALQTLAGNCLEVAAVTGARQSGLLGTRFDPTRG